jgi:hypothetical protein
MSKKQYLLTIIIFIISFFVIGTFNISAETFNIQFQTGWNMFSLPVNKTITKEEIAQKCQLGSSIWRYDPQAKQYSRATTLQPGYGYWILVKSPCVLTLAGEKVDIQNFPELKSGWNQISALTQPADVLDILGDCQAISKALKYDPSSGKYIETDTLEPGVSYWLKVENTCRLAAPPQPNQKFDFSFSTTPNVVTVVKGNPTSTNVNIGLLSGTAQSVNLSATTEDPTLSFKWSSANCTPNCNVNLTINTTNNTETKLHTITISSSGGEVIRTVYFGLTVTAQADATQCSDGTNFGYCSATKPKLCDNGSLIQKCTMCDCPSGQVCNSTTESCSTPGYNLKTNAFNNGRLVPAQVSFGKLAGDVNGDGFVDTTDLEICQKAFYSKRGDPTWDSRCDLYPDGKIDSLDIHVIADDFGKTPQVYTTSFTLNLAQGNYSPEADYGGQTQQKNINISGGQISIVNFNFSGGDICEDGTPYNQCSSQRPKLCDDGDLIINCNRCQCPSGQRCDTGTGYCYLPIPTQPVGNQCSDNTDYGQCNKTNQPKFCDNGNLIDYCRVCECPSGQLCNQETDQCYTPLKCADGTFENSCRKNTPPLFCKKDGTKLTLVSNCQECDCPEGQECQTDGSCKGNKCVSIKYSGNPDDKLDIIYVGSDYDDLASFSSDVSALADKLLSYEPFKTYSDRINIWRIDELFKMGCTYEGPADTPKGRIVSGCFYPSDSEISQCPYTWKDKLMVIINEDRNCGIAAGGRAVVCNGGLFAKEASVHELGHTLGGLPDHYKEDDYEWCVNQGYHCLMCTWGNPFGSPPDSKCNCLGTLTGVLKSYYK